MDIHTTWVSLTILAVIIWTSVDLFGKHVMDKEVDDAAIAAGTAGLPEFTLLSIISILITNVNFSIQIALPSILVGVLYALALLTYYMGVEREDITRFIPTLSMTAIFTVILAFVFLGEKFTLPVYIGIGGIVSGAILVSMEGWEKFQSFTGFIIGVLTAFLFGMRNVILKYTTLNVSLWPILFWIGIGGSVVSIIFLIFRFEKIKMIKFPGEKHMFEIGLLATFGYILYTMAISVGPVSLTSATLKIKMLLVFLGSTAISKLDPDIIHENLEEHIIVQKLIAIFLIIWGVVFIHIYS